jgi:DNA-binding NarL/FixJ family response regulator
MAKKNDKQIRLSMSLSHSRIRELEALRQVKGKHSVQELIEEAIGQFLRIHRPANLPLTPHQREILQLVAEGKESKEIAAHLDISVKTVEMHRTN